MENPPQAEQVMQGYEAQRKAEIERVDEGLRLVDALRELSASANTQEFKNKIDDALHTIRRSVEGGSDKQAA